MTIRYNLIIVDKDSDQYGTAINYRDDTVNMIVEHNTIVMPLTSNEWAVGFYGSTARPGCTFKNNIVQGSSKCFVNWDLGWTNPTTITYNYLYGPKDDFTEGNFSEYANNTETYITTPGFIGSGVIWQTNGTNSGTISEYYSLQSDAPAATACEGGTFCGAFGSITTDFTPPAVPTGVTII